MLLFPCVIRNTIECAFHEYSIVANRIVDAFRCGGFAAERSADIRWRKRSDAACACRAGVVRKER